MAWYKLDEEGNIEGLLKPLAPLINYVARLNGVDQYWQLSERLINPDGDIDIEFKTGSNVNGGGSDKVVLSQCLTAAYSGSSGKEFTLYFNASGYLQALHGGVFFDSSANAAIEPDKTYRWRLEGNQQEFFVDGVLVDSNTVSRGSAREPSAQCLIGAQTSGGALRAYFDGPIYDVKVNSAMQVEIPLTNKTQGATQLATVGNVNATMVGYTPDVWEVLPEPINPDLWDSQRYTDANGADTLNEIISGEVYDLQVLSATESNTFKGMRVFSFQGLDVGSNYIFKVYSNRNVNLAVYNGSYQLISDSRSTGELEFTASETTRLYVCPIDGELVRISKSTVRAL